MKWMQALICLGVGLAGCSGGRPSADSAARGVCGNGATEGDEQCDAGQFNSDEGACKSDCSLQFCGDGFVGPYEECDDGNFDDDDDCTTACTVPPLCPNGVVDEGEECDDGNDDANDGCLPNCTLARCGDGFVRHDLSADAVMFEECDEGVRNSAFAADACRTNCMLAHCGDGVVDSGEQCDEGAQNSNDTPNACRSDYSAPRCGDGVVDAGEECDEGADNSDDAPDACRSNCKMASCGDGVVDSGEACDTSGDSATCNADCTAPRCGDGYVNPAANEYCDTAGESATCDGDCSAPRCGDGYVNKHANEDCDSPTVPYGVCTLACALVCTAEHGDCNDVAADGCETDLMTSSLNCGACGHDCGGSDCLEGKCQPVKIATLPEVPYTSTIKAYEGSLFVPTTAGLARIDANARQETEPVLLAEVTPSFRAFAFDGGSVYFSAFTLANGYGIYAAPLNTGKPVLKAEAPLALALTSDGTHLYFASLLDDVPALMRYALADASVETVGSIPASSSILPGFDLEVDATHAYFPMLDKDEIWRVAKNAADPFPTQVSTTGGTFDIAADANWLYWVDSDAKKIRRVAKDPFACLPDPICSAVDFALVSGSPWALDVDATHVYWVERGTNLVRRKPITGGAVEELANNVTEPLAVLVVGDFVYWLEAPEGAPGAVWKVRP